MKYQAKKRFGQNFLQDNFIINHLFEIIKSDISKQIVEIGPGLGALTSNLCQLAKQVHVIEIDNQIVDYLKTTAYAEQLIIHHQDVLTFDFRQLTPSLTIIGNLPYNISTPLLFKMTNYVDICHAMFFMLQKEVVNRLTAQPGSSQFGKLSILLQYFFYIEDVLDIPPSAFSPQPKVDSKFIKIIPNLGQHGIAKNHENFTKLVKTAFMMKRKTIYNNLKQILPKETLIHLNIDPGARPEDLTIEQYILLSNHLTEHQTTIKGSNQYESTR